MENIMITLTLTETEAQELVSLIDAAVRAAGLQGAAAGLKYFTKLQEAVNAAPQDEQAEGE